MPVVILSVLVAALAATADAHAIDLPSEPALVRPSPRPAAPALIEGDRGHEPGPVLRLAQRGGKAATSTPPPEVPPPGPAAVTPSLQSCSNSYHAALTAIHASGGERLRRAVKAMSAFDNALPGRWLFWGPAGQSSRQTIETRRVCTVVAVQWGRKRCVHTEQRKVAGPIPVQTPAKAPAGEELKALRFVDETVKGRGALIEFGSNGRYKVMSERFADDLRIYTTQPPHPALCTGAEDLIAFYRETLAPLKKRVSVVAAATQRSRELTTARFRIAEAALSIARDATRIEGTGADAAAADAGVVKATVASAGPVPVPARPRDMIVALVRLAADPDVARSIEAGETEMDVLARAHAWAAGDQARALLPTQRETLLAALQMIEAAIYADTLRVRYAEIDETLFGALARLESAQKSSCTCAE